MISVVASRLLGSNLAGVLCYRRAANRDHASKTREDSPSAPPSSQLVGSPPTCRSCSVPTRTRVKPATTIFTGLPSDSDAVARGKPPGGAVASKTGPTGGSQRLLPLIFRGEQARLVLLAVSPSPYLSSDARLLIIAGPLVPDTFDPFGESRLRVCFVRRPRAPLYSSAFWLAVTYGPPGS